MRILFAGDKQRGVACLGALLHSGHEIVGVIVHPFDHEPGLVGEIALDHRLPLFQPDDVNADHDVLRSLEAMKPDLTVLAGYGPIVRQRFLDLAPKGCLNLHAGRLPQFRGSSPLNWVLLRGESEFTLSIIRADTGVDTGEVVAERSFAIGPNDTIADLHQIANREFPLLLVDLVSRMEAGPVPARKQDEADAAYYPLRFPGDGLVVWDMMTAQQIHNRIRALTNPYPGAFTFFKGRRVVLLGSRLAKRTYYGEPGRVYRKSSTGVLVCAADRCLWVARAVHDADGSDALAQVGRYDAFATVQSSLLALAVAQP